jgi:hypothetical protein
MPDWPPCGEEEAEDVRMRSEGGNFMCAMLSGVV